MSEPINKGGAPKGNTNALKHGKRSAICRGGKLRDNELQIERLRNKWLRRLEAAVTTKHGEISITHQLIIESIGDYLIQKMTLQRRYRTEKKIELRDQIMLMETIQRSNQEVLKLLKKLEIDAPDDAITDDDWEIEVT